MACLRSYLPRGWARSNFLILDAPNPQSLGGSRAYASDYQMQVRGFVFYGFLAESIPVSIPAVRD
ncbi:hypothetical protein HNQ77_005114 [Silvibacterium bohemicum]|uniref:Uncharacterized protein n=1 Tax=Silvibacterium bohemicum TaxID=1577686 RepID=A0A841K5C0_9BACT|nr:hypothetical protein [Silvibacterium bohemicum]